MVILKEGKIDKKMNSHKMQGKNEKFLKPVLKKDPCCAKHGIFVTKMSREQVTRNPTRQNLKNLSKYFSQLEGPPTRKLRSILSTPRDWSFYPWTSCKLSCKKSKNPDFWKIFLSLFCNWDLDLPVSCKNLLCKLATGACDWLEAWGESPEQGCTVFEIFENFQNKNTFQKQLKHFKIFCVWSTYNWAYATYLIKYNHTNE